jgi:long-chain acyl-CoA synthetase
MRVLPAAVMNNLGRLLLETSAIARERPALSDGDGTLTYQQLSDAAQAVERALRAVGLEADEPVLVPVANETRDPTALVGVWLAGGVVVPVARHAPAAAIETIRAATGARFSVSNDVDERVVRIRSEAPPYRPLLCGAAVVIFTSGSTGRPKGVVLSHHAFIGKLEAIDSQLNFAPSTRTLLVLQTAFVFGLWVLLLTLVKGGTVWMNARFDPVSVLAALKDLRISDIALVPTMLRRILLLDRAIASSLTGKAASCRILTGGEPFGRELSMRLQDLMPNAPVVDIYGSTETCSSDFFLAARESERFAETIGHPSPQVRFRIADDQGRELPVEALGELQIRTPFIMNGYLDEPEMTRSAFSDGYFRTGDLARIREDGRVELAGRIKELINRGGVKVSPLELDRILAQHPAVAAALTAGLPDPILGERIHALIVRNANTSLDEKTLREWIAEKIEGFKRPDVYHFVHELPTGRTGKVDRNALRDLSLQLAGTSRSKA